MLADVEFRDVLRRRRMVRAYDEDRPVPPDVIERLVRAAVRAPSAGFTQGWGFLVLDTREDVDRFREAATPESDPDRWFAANVRAPLIIGAISIGYPAEPGKDITADRKPLDEVVHRGRWNSAG